MNFEDFFKALGDETRLRILNLLLNSSSLRVSDIIEILHLPQSTVSRHLALLKRAGWLEDRRVEKWVYYRLDHQILPEFKAALSKMFKQSIMMQNDVKNLKSINGNF